jgi:hypothetical protein
MNASGRIASFAALLAGVVTLAGCGSGKVSTVPARGKVMFKKTTPAAGALVVFHPTDLTFEKRIGGKPFAKVQEDGSFTLTTFAEGDGAPEGEYGVTIDWQGKPKAAKLSLSSEGGSTTSLINPRYSNPQQPAFKATVKKGEANDFSFNVD